METNGVIMGKPINAEVYVRRGEPIERAIKRFMKQIKKEKVVEGILERRFYEKPSTARNKKNIRIKRKQQQLKEKLAEQENKR